jgi:hypothetical protein
MPGSDTIAGRLAGCYLDAAIAVSAVADDSRLMRKAGELALRDLESDLRKGIDSPIPRLSEYDEIVDRDAVDRLVARAKKSLSKIR